MIEYNFINLDHVAY